MRPGVPRELGKPRVGQIFEFPSRVIAAQDAAAPRLAAAGAVPQLESGEMVNVGSSVQGLHFADRASVMSEKCERRADGINQRRDLGTSRAGLDCIARTVVRKEHIK